MRCRWLWRWLGTQGAAGLLLVGLFAGTPAQARDAGSWEDVGTIGRDVLVAAAFGLPLVRKDWTGDLQAGGSIGATLLASEALKRATPERRPDGSNRWSFPSGHTSVSFAAAATLQNRDGWQIGLPAQIVATMVGLSRVQARRHYWQDVVAGALIGEAAGFMVTSRRSGAVQVVPWGDARGGGASLAWRF